MENETRIIEALEKIAEAQQKTAVAVERLAVSFAMLENALAQLGKPGTSPLAMLGSLNAFMQR